MLAGKGDPSGLRAAASEERESIDRLVGAARRIASNEDRKVNQTAFDRVAETLQAAGADSELAERVRAGRLDREARAATIGASARAPARSKRGGTAERADEDRAERERARAELERARRDLELAEGRRERAQQAVEKQTERLKQARAELSDARREAKAAEASVRRAEARARKKN